MVRIGGVWILLALLGVRAETRDLRGYELVRARADGRTGAGIRSPEINCDEYRATLARGEKPNHPIRYADRLPCVAVLMPHFQSDARPIPWKVTAGGARIADIVPLIGREIGRPIIDKTQLEGVYDVEIRYQPAADGVGDGEEPPLAQALQQQAGLKLVDTRVPSDVLVIESIKPPTEN